MAVVRAAETGRAAGVAVANVAEAVAQVAAGAGVAEAASMMMKTMLGESVTVFRRYAARPSWRTHQSHGATAVVEPSETRHY